MNDLCQQLQSVLDVVRCAKSLTVMATRNGYDPILIGAVGWDQLQDALKQLDANN